MYYVMCQNNNFLVIDGYRNVVANYYTFWEAQLACNQLNYQFNMQQFNNMNYSDPFYNNMNHNDPFYNNVNTFVPHNGLQKPGKISYGNIVINIPSQAHKMEHLANVGNNSIPQSNLKPVNLVEKNNNPNIIDEIGIVNEQNLISDSLETFKKTIEPETIVEADSETKTIVKDKTLVQKEESKLKEEEPETIVKADSKIMEAKNDKVLSRKEKKKIKVEESKVIVEADSETKNAEKDKTLTQKEEPKLKEEELKPEENKKSPSEKPKNKANDNSFISLGDISSFIQRLEE